MIEKSWRDVLFQHVGELEWRNVRRDVASFLEIPEELDLLTRENLLGLLD